MARLLHVEMPPEKKHNFTVHGDMDMMDEVRSASTEISITEDLIKGSNLLMDLGLPSETLAILIKRPRRSADGEVMFVPNGKTELRPHDKLLVIGNNKVMIEGLEDYLIKKSQEAAMLRNQSLPIIEDIKSLYSKLCDKIRKLRSKKKGID